MRHVICASLAALACGAAHADIDIYSVALYGANECAGGPLTCGAGDPDGWGAGTVMIDPVATTVSWNILAFGIDMPLTGAHIHQAAAGSNGPVVINFSAALSGSVVDADAAGINAGTADGYYVNLHNAAYAGGAIRGQLVYERTVAAVPEPGRYALLLAGLGVIGWVSRRRA